MADTESGTETKRQAYERVLQAAFDLYSQDDPGPDWVTFFRKILGLKGLVRRTFRMAEELEEFEQSEVYAEILHMLTRLREQTVPPDDPNEPIRIITIRLPKSLHEALRVQAYEHQTSMNKLCISKLLQFIDNGLIPRERWKRVADRRSPAADESGHSDEEPGEVEEQAEEKGAGADL